jgi:hypothetical protein
MYADIIEVISMKRIMLYGALSFLPLALLLGSSSAMSPGRSASLTPTSVEAAPSCRRVHGTACAPEGETVRCSIGDEIRVCVCENRTFNCR